MWGVYSSVARKENSYRYKEVINLLCIEPFKENIENIYSLPVFYLFAKSKKQQYAGAGTASFGVLMSQKTLKGSSSLSNFIYTNI